MLERRQFLKISNLSADYPERVRQLADLLTRYLREVKAQMPMDRQTGRSVEWPADAVRAVRQAATRRNS